MGPELSGGVPTKLEFPGKMAALRYSLALILALAVTSVPVHGKATSAHDHGIEGAVSEAVAALQTDVSSLLEEDETCSGMEKVDFDALRKEDAKKAKPMDIGRVFRDMRAFSRNYVL